MVGAVGRAGRRDPADQGAGRAGRDRQPLAGNADGLREAQAEPRLLRQDLPHGPLLVGHADGESRGVVLVQGRQCGARPATTTTCGAWTRRRRPSSWRRSSKPWVAFKVMAAGAIHPRMAFSHAYPERRGFHRRRHVRFPGRSRTPSWPSSRCAKRVPASGLGVRDGAAASDKTQQHPRPHHDQEDGKRAFQRIGPAGGAPDARPMARSARWPRRCRPRPADTRNRPRTPAVRWLAGHGRHTPGW